MSVRYRIDETAGVAFAEFDGEVTDQDLAEFLPVFHNEVSGHGITRRIFDFRKVTKVDVSTSGVKAAADYFSQFDETLKAAKIALVASSDEAYGMCRMYDSLRSDAPYEIRTLRSMKEARRWFGIPDPDAQT